MQTAQTLIIPPRDLAARPPFRPDRPLVVHLPSRLEFLDKLFDGPSGVLRVSSNLKTRRKTAQPTLSAVGVESPGTGESTREVYPLPPGREVDDPAREGCIPSGRFSMNALAIFSDASS